MRKARLKDTARLQLFVKNTGRVPSSGELSDYIGETRQRVARRWGAGEHGAPKAWEALYKSAGLERPSGRGDYRRGRALTEEHRRKISEGVRRRWKQRKRKEAGT